MIANVPLEGMSRVGYMDAAAGGGSRKVIGCLWVSEW